ncbi:caspase-13-like isoform 2-T7 [Trichechus inunguis]
MAEDNKENPFKVFESLGKEILSGLLDNVEKKYLNLSGTEKEKFYGAKPADKLRVLEASVRKKRDEAGRILVETFFSKEKESTSAEVPSEMWAGPDESAEFTDTLELCPPEEFLRLCKEKAGEIYPIKERKNRTRLALIICNIEFNNLPPRSRAEVDIEGMKRLLEGLDYSVEVKKQLTATEMQSVLQEFAARPEHRSSDSTFLVFMSHGFLEGICGTTHSEEQPDMLSLDTIFQIFNNNNCQSLKDKPKIIIVQACRGANSGEPLVRDSPSVSEDSPSESSDNLEADAVHIAHVEKDFIAFWASAPYNLSWRDEREGSPFITRLISYFHKYSSRCHLVEVFRKVQRSFEKPPVKIQVPTIKRHTLIRCFYLFPGN